MNIAVQLQIAFDPMIGLDPMNCNPLASARTGQGASTLNVSGVKCWSNTVTLDVFFRYRNPDRESKENSKRVQEKCSSE